MVGKLGENARKYLAVVVLSLGVSSGACAGDRYVETFLHLKPRPDNLGAFVVDLYTEDASYAVSFAMTIPVQDMRLVVETDMPDGMSRDWLLAQASRDRSSNVYVALAVSTDPPTSIGVLSAELQCDPVSAAQQNDIESPGVICSTVYDAGDSGQFFVEPMFDDDGVARLFDLHFRVSSQKTLDHAGTPDGDPFVGALLNGRQDSIDRSVVEGRELFANARPVLRLKNPAEPVAVRFEPFRRSVAH